eukprot:2418068-Heterocapsa_arctica.AAC.1
MAPVEDEPQGLVGSLGFRPHEDDGRDVYVVLAVDDDLLLVSGSPFQVPILHCVDGILGVGGVHEGNHIGKLDVLVVAPVELPVDRMPVIE